MNFSNFFLLIAIWEQYFYILDIPTAIETGNEKRLSMKYLPLFADLRDQTTVVIGGGETAAQKLRLLLRAQAKPLVFAASPNKEIKDLEHAGLIRLRHDAFDTAQLIDCGLLVIADPAELRAVEIAAAARRVLACPKPRKCKIPLWDGRAAGRIAAVIARVLKGKGRRL